jgi:hypothetical protein
MKYILLLFLSISAFAQDTISIEEVSKPQYYEDHARAIVTVDNTNIVYRGITNKINIAVMGVDPWDVMCNAPGSFKPSGITGEFLWNVTAVAGKTATINVAYRLANGERKVEAKEFEIREVENFNSLINGYGGKKCIVEQSLKELKNAKISVEPKNIMWESLREVKVIGFTLVMPNDEGYYISGDTITDEIYKKLKELKPGSVFRIIVNHFILPHSSVMVCKAEIVKVIITKDGLE